MSTLSEQAISIPETGTYRLDPAESTITFATRHLFGLGMAARHLDIELRGEFRPA